MMELANEILGLAYGYEEKLKSYQFYNDQLAELERIEDTINDKITPLLENEELLLAMIKQRWSIIRSVKDKKDVNFFIKACIANPMCGKEARNLDLLIELNKVAPEAVKNAPPYYREQFEKYLSTQQTASQVFYSLDGTQFATLQEALDRNEQLMLEAPSVPGMK